jgi:DNA-binding NarL/FixJ family response regulator
LKRATNAILSKLGAQSRTDAVVRATRSGLLDLI